MADRVALGKIGKAHGLQGAFRVWPYADDLERFALLKEVSLTRGPKSAQAKVLSVQQAPGYVIMQTDLVQTPEEVQIWLGGDVEVELAQRIKLPEGQYFHDQIVGLKARTVDGTPIGVVVRVMDGPGNDIYVCSDGAREYLIPAVPAFIKSIDLNANLMVIDPIEGLLE